MSQQETRPTAAFVLLLLSGTFIILGSSIIAFFFYPVMMGNYYYGWMGGMMGTWYGHGRLIPQVFYWVSIVGIVLGIIVLLAAWRISSYPSESTQWGIVALVASALSLLAMGGFLIGSILGIIGSALAIAYSPVSSQSKIEQSRSV